MNTINFSSMDILKRNLKFFFLWYLPWVLKSRNITANNQIGGLTKNSYKLYLIRLEKKNRFHILYTNTYKTYKDIYGEDRSYTNHTFSDEFSSFQHHSQCFGDENSLLKTGLFADMPY